MRKGDGAYGESTMKSLNMKLALSAVAIAMLATPALAARAHPHVTRAQTQDYTDTQAQAPMLHYPDGGAGRTGSLASEQSGAEFNLGQ
jgi:hypothetical protein